MNALTVSGDAAPARWELTCPAAGADVDLQRKNINHLCTSMLWLRCWWDSHQDVVRAIDSKAAARATQPARPGGAPAVKVFRLKQPLAAPEFRDMAELEPGFVCLDALMRVLNPGLDRKRLCFEVLLNMVPHARCLSFGCVGTAFKKYERRPAISRLLHRVGVYKEVTHFVKPVFSHQRLPYRKASSCAPSGRAMLEAALLFRLIKHGLGLHLMRQFFKVF